MAVDFTALHPRFAAMRDHLEQLRRQRRLPRCRDLDPADIAGLLPFVNLIDVVLQREALRFRFRLVGLAQSHAARRAYQGLFVDEAVDPAWRKRVSEDLSRAVATLMPQYGRYGMPFPGRGFIESERVFFPLSEDGRMVDRILALHHYPALEALEAAAFAPAPEQVEAWRSALADVDRAEAD